MSIRYKRNIGEHLEKILYKKQISSMILNLLKVHIKVSLKIHNDQWRYIRKKHDNVYPWNCHNLNHFIDC